MKKDQIINITLVIFLLSGSIIFPFTAVDEPKSSIYPSCTIFTVTSKNNDIVYFCNNEDYVPNHMRMYFFPASEGKYGKILYGFTYQHAFNPLGGMNDQGLSADENGLPSTPVKVDPNRINYTKNNVFTLVLENCATVAEAIEFLKNYNLIELESYPCQTHIADKTGDAAVIGIAKDGTMGVTRKSGNYLISTNFNVNQGRQECWRYDTAEKMLNDMKEVSLENCLSILKATHLGLWTRYSNINDLKNGNLYFYSALNDYNGFAVINLNEELSKGFHSYDILTLINRSARLFPNASQITYSIVALSIIMVGCALIWKYGISPKFGNNNKKMENKQVLKKGENNG